MNQRKRLIDAYKLIESFIPDRTIDWYTPWIIENINDQPTAYDIDKVIEQLEALEKEHPYKVIGQPDTYSWYNEAWCDCIDRVIQIVKKGGAE